MKQKFYSIITGTFPGDVFAGFAFFAVLGIALSLLWHTTERNVRSDGSPLQFSWKYMLRDNVKRILASVISVYICLRFAPEVIGINLTDFWAFGVGLGFDKISELIKNKTNLLNVKK